MAFVAYVKFLQEPHVGTKSRVKSSNFKKVFSDGEKPDCKKTYSI